jgi:hypothetical protein
MTKAGVFRLLFDILLPAKTTVGTSTVSKFYFDVSRMFSNDAISQNSFRITEVAL